MDQLTALNAANPHIPIYSVHGEAFHTYGRVIAADTGAICKTAEDAVVFPSEGSKYLASVPELEALPELAALQEEYCGQRTNGCLPTRTIHHWCGGAATRASTVKTG